MRNKKILISALVILLAVTGGYAATRAFFSARQTVNNSQFTVGTLDMSVTGDNNVANEPFVVTNIGASGGISGGKTWTIRNTGSLPGRLFFRFQNVVNAENGCNEPERLTETACAADNLGEMGAVLQTVVSLDGNEVITGKTLSTDDTATYGPAWSALPNVIIDAGATKTVRVAWSADENAYGNEIQSDSVAFSTDFRLVQLITGPTPTN
ncbi:MAG: hypothetical protein WCV93_05130 [Candidatus Shapirobacteria bacterium]